MAAQTASIAPSIIRPPSPVEEFVRQVHDTLGHCLDEIEVLWGQILVAKFVREKIGSIITSNKTRREDLYQGNIGLVLKLGPIAFKDDPDTKFHGQKVNVGDWVCYRASDGIDYDITPSPTSATKVACRLLEQETMVRMRVKRPDLIY